MEKIPHIIHYCWFGRNPKSELVLNCIESWKKYLPGYEIREWNEDNYDVTQVNFVKEAYENQKWAFVSDYVRFDVLYQFGGIYFDTDVELLKPIPEEILAKRAFTGFESTKLISPGLVMGSIKGLNLISEILEEYQKFFPSSVEIIMTYAALERVSYEGLMGFLNELPDALNDFINKDPDIIIVPSMTGSAIKGYEIVNKLEQRSGRAVLVPSLEIKKCLKTAGISRIAIVSAFGVELGLLEQLFFRNHNIWITNLINIFDDESQDRLRVDCIDNNRVIKKTGIIGR